MSWYTCSTQFVVTHVQAQVVGLDLSAFDFEVALDAEGSSPKHGEPRRTASIRMAASATGLTLCL